MRGDPICSGRDAAARVALVFGMQRAEAGFRGCFSRARTGRSIEQDSFLSLTLAHIGLVGGFERALPIVIGAGAGIFVTRPSGREFRPLVETSLRSGRPSRPSPCWPSPCRCSASAQAPALIALALYGLLADRARRPWPASSRCRRGVREAAQGIGMSAARHAAAIELPLAAPVILAGIRTSVIINIGTAAIASTVGAKTLGLPIIVGLSGFNTAYVLQGALVVGLLAIVVDLAFGRLLRHVDRWRDGAASDADADAATGHASLA